MIVVVVVAFVFITFDAAATVAAPSCLSEGTVHGPSGSGRQCVVVIAILLVGLCVTLSIVIIVIIACI